MTDICRSCFIFALGIIASPKRRALEIAIHDVIGSVGGILFLPYALMEEFHPASIQFSNAGNGSEEGGLLSALFA